MVHVGIVIVGSHDRSIGFISLSLPRPDLKRANRSGLRAGVEIYMSVRDGGWTSPIYGTHIQHNRKHQSCKARKSSTLPSKCWPYQDDVAHRSLPKAAVQATYQKRCPDEANQHASKDEAEMHLIISQAEAGYQALSSYRGELSLISPFIIMTL
jgi:hypothetical protein